MTDRRRGEGKELKKDQQVRREVLDEIGSEIQQDGTTPQYRNPNRDQARGDWDRSGRHTDESGSREGPASRTSPSPVSSAVSSMLYEATVRRSPNIARDANWIRQITWPCKR